MRRLLALATASALGASAFVVAVAPASLAGLPDIDCTASSPVVMTGTVNQPDQSVQFRNCGPSSSLSMSNRNAALTFTASLGNRRQYPGTIGMNSVGVTQILHHSNVASISAVATLLIGDVNPIDCSADGPPLSLSGAVGTSLAIPVSGTCDITSTTAGVATWTSMGLQSINPTSATDDVVVVSVAGSGSTTVEFRPADNHHEPATLKVTGLVTGATPKPSLTTSSSTVTGSTGTAIGPVVLQPADFPPTAISVAPAAGSALPAGLSIAATGPGQWSISGTPTAAFSGDVVLEATVGPSSASTTVHFDIADSCAPVKPAGQGTLAARYVITTPGELAYLRDTPAARWTHSVLAHDLDMSGCPWTEPIGSKLRPFTGTFNGLGHVIDHLTVVASAEAGLFGWVGGRDGSIRSVHLTNANISGRVAGGIAARLVDRAEIKAASVTGKVAGTDVVGGIVGRFESSGVVINTRSDARVVLANGAQVGGGLVGGMGSQARLFNSLAVGPVVTSGAWAAGPLVGRGTGTVTAVVWNAAASGISSNGIGLERTVAQMRDVSTYRALGWRIADGWDGAMPWGICSGEAYPFLAERVTSDPCARLTASTASVVLQRGLAMTPVAFTASNFVPTAYSVSKGSLPAGLKFDDKTGMITGTPKKAARAQLVTVTGTQGHLSHSTSVSIMVRPAQDGDIPKECTSSKDAVTLAVTVVCEKPGEYTVTAPAGYVLDSTDLLGADGAGANDSDAWLVPAALRDRFGFGAHAKLGNLATPSSAQALDYIVTVGSTPTAPHEAVGGFHASTRIHLGGGGFSSVAVDALPGATSPLAVAGGGGGSFRTAAPATDQAWCEIWQAVGKPSKEECLNGLREYIPSAGAADWDKGQATGTWPGQATGSPGALEYLEVCTNFICWTTKWEWFATASRPGTTFAPATADVSTRPAATTPRNGKVTMVFIPGGSEDPVTCSDATVQLGQTVVCDKPGASTVKVPAGARVALASVSGAGGGGAFAEIKPPAPLTSLTGGPGATVTGTIDVSSTSSLALNVGAGGTAKWWTPNWSNFYWYGSGGGASTVSTSAGIGLIGAGGGGGANGLSASSVPGGGLVNSSTPIAAIGSARILDSSGAPTGGSSGYSLQPGGRQGASFVASSVVSGDAYSASGPAGGSINWTTMGAQDSPVAKDGVITLRFCGLPDAPHIASITPGSLPGVPTVDVIATGASDGGCDTDRYEFRTSSQGSWVSAPSLKFAINYLSGAQTVCVEMRAHNAAGWSDAGESVCGVASSLAADVQAGGSVTGAVITVGTSGFSTPTTIYVNPGDTFTVQNYGTATNEAYLRPDVTGGATVTKAGITCVGNGSTVPANCFLAPSMDSQITPGVTVFTVVSRGSIVIYSGSSNHMQTTTIAIS